MNLFNWFFTGSSLFFLSLFKQLKFFSKCSKISYLIITATSLRHRHLRLWQRLKLFNYSILRAVSRSKLRKTCLNFVWNWIPQTLRNCEGPLCVSLCRKLRIPVSACLTMPPGYIQEEDRSLPQDCWMRGIASPPVDIGMCGSY